MFGEEKEDAGDQMGATKPFVGQVRAMTPEGFKVTKAHKTLPDGNLKLKYCHGYRCFDDCRNTAKFLEGSSKIVFVGAALGVVMDVKTSRIKILIILLYKFFNLKENKLIL